MSARGTLTLDGQNAFGLHPDYLNGVSTREAEKSLRLQAGLRPVK